MLVNRWMKATFLIVGHHSQVFHEPVHVSWTVPNVVDCRGDRHCSVHLSAPQHRPCSNIAGMTHKFWKKSEFNN